MPSRNLLKAAHILRGEGFRSFGNRGYFFLLKKTYPSIESGCIKINNILPNPHLFKPVDGILMYHGTSQDGSDFYGNTPPSKLKHDLYNLSLDFDFVKLSQIPQSEGQMQIALTFDDGFASFYKHALPILHEMEIPATVFVNPGFIGDSNKSKIESAHNIRTNDRITMDQSELLELIDDELVMIGNHGMFHRHLGQISDEGILREEIVESKSILEREFGIQPRGFCYPYGSYSPTAVELVKEEYEYAVSSDMYTVTSYSEQYLLPRIAAHEDLEAIR